ncbi:sugar kinase [Lysobacter korlensis]|uniref:Sugar kinase n=1 Tax=Lysobacter korlensis TaxID=553636 RepID=A0ABV6RT26_9GAMM
MTGTGRVLTLGEGLGVLRTGSVGSVATASALDVGTGGAELNVAIGLARLGTAVTWVGRVGDDGIGRRVLRELRAEGVDVRAAVDPEAPTGLLLKEFPIPGRSVVSYYRAGSAGSRLSPDDLSPIHWSGVALLHVTGITPAISPTASAAVDAAIDAASAAGAAISFDVNHRSRLWSAADAAPVYRRLAQRATIVFAGEDEASLLAPGARRDAETLMRAIASSGVREVILKRGALGASALVDGERFTRDGVPISAVDTVGAGDAFVAGYLAELLAGSDVPGRLTTAVRTGALACLHPGDWEGAPRRADLALLDDGEPVHR